MTREEYLEARTKLIEKIALGDKAKEWLKNLENNQLREFVLKETVQECFDCKTREPVEVMAWYPDIGAGLCLDCSKRRYPFKSNISPL